MISSDAFDVDVCNRCGLMGYFGWYYNTEIFLISMLLNSAVSFKVSLLPVKRLGVVDTDTICLQASIPGTSSNEHSPSP